MNISDLIRCVEIHSHEGKGFVRLREIPEPWRSQFTAALRGSGCPAHEPDIAFAHDWEAWIKGIWPGREPLAYADSLLASVTRPRFDAVEGQAFRLFAEAVWYKTEILEASAARLLGDELRDRGQKAKLLYLLDRMRRFPCLTEENASLLASLVKAWGHLKPDVAQSPSRRVDKLAVAWGLDEDAMHLLGNVLDLQTRHHARAISAESGFPKPEPRKP